MGLGLTTVASLDPASSSYPFSFHHCICSPWPSCSWCSDQQAAGYIEAKFQAIHLPVLVKVLCIPEAGLEWLHSTSLLVATTVTPLEAELVLDSKAPSSIYQPPAARLHRGQDTCLATSELSNHPSPLF